MSQTLSVSASKGTIPSVNSWQRVIDEAGFDLKLDETVEPSRHIGFWPCQLRGELSGFELSINDPAESPNAIGVERVVVSFNFGGWADEAMSAMMAASSLASFTGSELIDLQSGAAYPAANAIAIASRAVAALEDLYAKQKPNRIKRNAG